MNIQKTLRTIVLCFVILVSTPFLQSCDKNKSDDELVENAVTWAGSFEKENDYKVAIDLKTGDKDGAKWISLYDVEFMKYDSTGTLLYAVLKSDDDPVGIVEFENGTAVVSIVSANSEYMPHYFAKGSQMIIHTSGNNIMNLHYTIILNDGSIFQGQIDLTVQSK